MESQKPLSEVTKEELMDMLFKKSGLASEKRPHIETLGDLLLEIIRTKGLSARGFGNKFGVADKNFVNAVFHHNRYPKEKSKLPIERDPDYLNLAKGVDLTKEVLFEAIKRERGNRKVNQEKEALASKVEELIISLRAEILRKIEIDPTTLEEILEQHRADLIALVS